MAEMLSVRLPEGHVTFRRRKTTAFDAEGAAGGRTVCLGRCFAQRRQGCDRTPSDEPAPAGFREFLRAEGAEALDVAGEQRWIGLRGAELSLRTLVTTERFIGSVSSLRCTQLCGKSKAA